MKNVMLYGMHWMKKVKKQIKTVYDMMQLLIQQVGGFEAGQ